MTDAWDSGGAEPALALVDRYAAAQHEIELMRQALEDQTRLADALRARAESASAHETELRALLLDAHAQLLERDAAIAELRGTGVGQPGGPRSLLEDRTLWAQRAVADVAQRDEVIRQLQAALDEQTAWAQRSAAEVAHRDAIIHQLQASARWSGVVLTRFTLLRRTVPGRLRALARERFGF